MSSDAENDETTIDLMPTIQTRPATVVSTKNDLSNSFNTYYNPNIIQSKLH